MVDSLVCSVQNQDSVNQGVELPNELYDEEAGYLSIHIMDKPPATNHHDSTDKQVAFFLHQKEKIIQSHYKVLNSRMRFREMILH
jgi:GTPase SAR1 family protein